MGLYKNGRQGRSCCQHLYISSPYLVASLGDHFEVSRGPRSHLRNSVSGSLRLVRPLGCARKKRLLLLLLYFRYMRHSSNQASAVFIDTPSEIALTDCFGHFFAGVLMLGDPLLPKRSTAELARFHALFHGATTPVSLPPRFAARSFGGVSIVLGFVPWAAHKGKRGNTRAGKRKI